MILTSLYCFMFVAKRCCVGQKFGAVEKNISFSEHVHNESNFNNARWFIWSLRRVGMKYLIFVNAANNNVLRANVFLRTIWNQLFTDVLK